MDGLTVKEEMQFRAQIAKKITKIGTEIGKMKLDGLNTFSNYKYISADQMNAEVREKSEQFGICIVPSILSTSEQTFHTTEKDKNGVEKTKTTVRTAITMSIQVIDTDTGYTLDCQFTGSDQDTGGKSEQQAISQCFKYFLFKLFKVSSKDEQDSDGKTTEVYKSEPTPPKAKETISDERFAAMLSKLNEGAVTFATVQNKFVFNAAQIAILKDSGYVA